MIPTPGTVAGCGINRNDLKNAFEERSWEKSLQKGIEIFTLGVIQEKFMALQKSAANFPGDHGQKQKVNQADEMKKWSLLPILASLLIAPHATAEENLAVGVRASTLGSGLELTLPMSQHFNLRGQGNGFAYSHTLNEGNLSYDADLRLVTVGGVLDFHPFAGSFHLSAGAFYNGNEFELEAKPIGNTFNINGTTFTLSQAGSINGEVTFNNISPYVGIGWGNPVSKGSKWGFQFEIGALYQGEPNVTLTASGSVASLASNIASEQAALQNALNDPLFRWYPVVSLAISYRF